MTSVCSQWFQLTAHQRPSIGDMKTSALGIDHMGWLVCDGRALNIVDFPMLFNVIGHSFGSNTSADFFLPNPAGRVPGFVGSGAGLTTRTLGSNVGEETHTLTIAEMPAHTHGSVDVSGNTNGNGVTGNTSLDLTQTSLVSSINVGTGNNGINVAGTATVVTSVTAQNVDPSITPNPHNHTIGSTGGGTAHNNMQPTLFVGNMFIYCGNPFYGSNAVTPVFPFTEGIFSKSTASPGSNLA